MLFFPASFDSRDTENAGDNAILMFFFILFVCLDPSILLVACTFIKALIFV